MLPEDEVGSIIYDVRIAAIYLQRTLSASGCVCSTRGLVWIVLSKAIVLLRLVNFWAPGACTCYRPRTRGSASLPCFHSFFRITVESFSDLIDRANG